MSGPREMDHEKADHDDVAHPVTGGANGRRTKVNMNMWEQRGRKHSEGIEGCPVGGKQSTSYETQSSAR